MFSAYQGVVKESTRFKQQIKAMLSEHCVRLSKGSRLSHPTALARLGQMRKWSAVQAILLEQLHSGLVAARVRRQKLRHYMHGPWGMGQMMFSKYIVVVDEDCDVHNTSEVLFRLCANTDPQRDSPIIKNPSDSLDHAPTTQNVGSHMGFDATRKLRGEGYPREWPELLKMTDEARALVDELKKKTG